MGAHVHDPFQDEHIDRWGAERMRRHLRDVHEMSQLPMAWDIGRLHQAHLDAHQAVKRAAPEPEAEDPQICGAFYGLGGGLAGQCARPVNHPPISVDGIGHNQAPIPIKSTAEEAPMTQTTPHEHTAAEHRGDGPELAQHLGKAHGYHSSNDLEDFTLTHRRLHAEAARPADPAPEDDKLSDEEKIELLAATSFAIREGGDWDDVGQETRDFYRDQARVNLAAVIEAKQAGAVAELRKSHVVHAERQEARQITVDRIICTLAGLDFDRDWAADSGMGPNARGAIRKVYAEQAEKMLTWLERGGAMALPGYASIGTDLDREQALVTDLEQINNTLREQLATTGRQLQTALSQKDGLFSEMGELRQELAREKEHSAGLALQARQLVEDRAAALQQLEIDRREHGASLDAVQRQLEEVNARAGELSTQVDLLSGDLEAVTAERDEARDERDRAQQAAMKKYGEAGEMRQKLADLVAELKESGWGGSSVFQKLVQIVSSGVSTVTEASPAPVEQPVLLHGDTSGIRHVEPTDDNLLWAQQFIAGGEA